MVLQKTWFLLTLLAFEIGYCGAEKWGMVQVVEPKCMGCKCMGTRTPEVGSVKALLSNWRYLLFANKVHLNKYFINEYGRMIETDEDIQSVFCGARFRGTFDSNGHIKVVYSSHQLKGNFKCNGKRYWKCKMRRKHDGQLSEHAASIVGDSTYASHVVWFSKTTLLLTFCYGSEGYSGFAVTSTRKKLAKREKAIVMTKLKKLGFDPAAIVDINTYCGTRK